MLFARVVELADSLDSGSSAHYGRAGSSPASRTKKEDIRLDVLFFCVRGGLDLKPIDTGAPRKSASFCGERTNSGASESCRLRRDEGCVACEDAVPPRAPLARPSTLTMAGLEPARLPHIKNSLTRGSFLRSVFRGAPPSRTCPESAGRCPAAARRQRRGTAPWWRRGRSPWGDP